MTGFLVLLQVVAPLLLKSAEDGSLAEIVATALKLLGLIKPLISDTRTIAAAESLATTIRSFAPAPAQPADPAMNRVAPDHKFGGR